MPDDLHRRWDDVIEEINRQVPPAIRQAMVDYRITVEETARDVQQLKIVVFGSPTIGVRGLVDRFGGFEQKLDALLKQTGDREEHWQQMLAFLGRDEERQSLMKAIKRGVGRANIAFGLVAGIAALIGLLSVLHIISP